MMVDDSTTFLKLALAAADAKSAQARRKACKRLLVLCWLNITPGDRWSFWDRTAPGTLDFVPPEPGEAIPDSDIAYMKRRWHEIVPRIADPKARKFASDLQRRLGFTNFTPSEKQVGWMKQLWADYGTEEIDVPIVEDDDE